MGRSWHHAAPHFTRTLHVTLRHFFRALIFFWRRPPAEPGHGRIISPAPGGHHHPNARGHSPVISPPVIATDDAVQGLASDDPVGQAVGARKPLIAKDGSIVGFEFRISPKLQEYVCTRAAGPTQASYAGALLAAARRVADHCVCRDARRNGHEHRRIAGRCPPGGPAWTHGTGAHPDWVAGRAGRHRHGAWHVGCAGNTGWRQCRPHRATRLAGSPGTLAAPGRQNRLAYGPEGSGHARFCIYAAWRTFDCTRP